MATAYSHSLPCPLDEVPQWDLEADVVVVGYGAAGAAAAAEAAAHSRVRIFEVASGRGGTSAMAGGDIYLGGGGGTPAQRANGFEDRTEDFFRYMMMAGGPDADEERVRLYADQALAHYEWLVAQGVPYATSYVPGKTFNPGTGDCLIWSGNEAAWPFREFAKPCPRGHLPAVTGELGGGGRKLVDCLGDRAESLGAQAHFDARARALIRDAEDRVCGVVIRIAGRDRFVQAHRAVILCAGGFVLDDDMLRAHIPTVSRLANDALSAGHDDGSGIRMGQSVGGAALHMEQLFLMLPLYPPESHVCGILVNERGQRFINEDAYGARIAAHCARQPGGRVFLLLDDAVFERPSVLSRFEIAAVEESWEAIERSLGLAEGALAPTVAHFNLHAAEREDPLFHKDPAWLKPLDRPPFAALACHVGEAFYPYFTLGGLSTRPGGQVLRADGTVVPGLYAAGRTSCGLPRSGENYSSGMSLGDCTFFGRMAGAHASGSEPPYRVGSQAEPAARSSRR